MTETEVIKHSINRLTCDHNGCICLPNFYLHNCECDIMLIMPSGISSEFEVKLTKADFKNDAKKQIHHFRVHSGNKLEYVLQGGLTNYFYYILPEELIPILENDIPSKFGICYLEKGKYVNNDYYSFHYHRQATQLHKNKIFDYKKLAHQIYGKFLNLYLGRFR